MNMAISRVATQSEGKTSKIPRQLHANYIGIYFNSSRREIVGT